MSSFKPSRLASTQFSAPKAPVVQPTKPAVPLKPKPAKVPEASTAQHNMMMQPLDMRTWDKNPLDIIKHLTEQEFIVDAHSGFLNDKKPAQDYQVFKRKVTKQL